VSTAGQPIDRWVQIVHRVRMNHVIGGSEPDHLLNECHQFVDCCWAVIKNSLRVCGGVSASDRAGFTSLPPRGRPGAVKPATSLTRPGGWAAARAAMVPTARFRDFAE
jgi:hypothetical protein